jgi:hypothetical protein
MGWKCTITTDGQKSEHLLDADDMDSAITQGQGLASSLGGEFDYVELVNTERQAAIAKLVSSGLLTEAEATALAGG